MEHVAVIRNNIFVSLKEIKMQGYSIIMATGIGNSDT
jgi:hypothetical protein